MGCKTDLGPQPYTETSRSAPAGFIHSSQGDASERMRLHAATRRSASRSAPSRPVSTRAVRKSTDDSRHEMHRAGGQETDGPRVLLNPGMSVGLRDSAGCAALNVASRYHSQTGASSIPERRLLHRTVPRDAPGERRERRIAIGPRGRRVRPTPESRSPHLSHPTVRCRIAIVGRMPSRSSKPRFDDTLQGKAHRFRAAVPASGAMLQRLRRAERR